MSWRTSLAVLLGLLLPLPLVWLLYTAMYGQEVPRTQEAVLIPMLTSEERRGRVTYERECRTDADCEPPLGCFFNMRSQMRYCTDSVCMTDAHCPEGFVCRTLDMMHGKARVRACSLVGVRQEGESCMALPSTREHGCGVGLICQGRCGRSCRLDDPASCPEGFFCEQGLEGPSCLPTCEGRPCPEGQRCVPMDGRTSICATVHGQDCEQSPCPQDQECSVYAYPEHPGELWMECLRPCGSKHPACPEGTVCHLFRCRKSCDPEDPSACGPGFRCGRRSWEPWTCVPGSAE